MKQFLAYTLLASAASALPHGAKSRSVASVTTHTHSAREVPQEKAHEGINAAVKVQLDKNNPDEIVDPVFGLLGNAAGIKGAGKIADATCLQQATADQAFTNAKAAGDVAGMVNALIYRALERNSGKVGLVTDPCTSIKAKNPEIAALSQHQDPASDNAAEVNKAITLELAKQIASVGGNPLDALLAGTFAPGDVNDPTAKGNSCDVDGDAVGCIFSLNLIVADATEDEINAAVAGVAAAPAAGAANAAAEAADAKAGKAAAAGDAAAADKAAAAGDAAAADKAAAAGDAAAAAGNVAAAAGKLDFGSCSNPAIQFAENLDGRKDPSFQAVDLTDFNHGSALNIGVITGFIKDRLKDGCKAGDDAIAAADKAETAAKAATGQAAADAWNSALGVSA